MSMQGGVRGPSARRRMLLNVVATVAGREKHLSESRHERRSTSSVENHVGATGGNEEGRRGDRQNKHIINARSRDWIVRTRG